MSDCDYIPGFDFMLEELEALADERLTDWEREFVADVAGDANVAEYGPTDAQEAKVEEIYEAKMVKR